VLREVRRTVFPVPQTSHRPSRPSPGQTPGGPENLRFILTAFQHPRQGLLQHRPPVYTRSQQGAAGGVSHPEVLRGQIQDCASRFPYREIVSGIPDFAHTRTPTHPGTGTGGCVRVLLYFSTKREMRLSICKGTAGFGAVPGRLIFAAGAGILR